jgi:hydroxymethylpyrimidine pyrophosphatase-like HAD family hydrolase
MISVPPLRPADPRRPFLLAADIDGTLLGDEEGLAALRALVRAFPDSVLLAVISGRSRASIQALIADGILPPPRFIGSAVGSELLDCADPENRLGEKYAARAEADWSVESVYSLGEGEGMRRQAFPEGQPRFQAGFDWDGRPATLAALRHRLAPLQRCRIVPSQDRFVDVFPEGFGKGELARFLQSRLGVHPERTVVAGDSGNDREMFETGFRGIVPVNALDELKRAADRPRHYHSPWPSARGVIDGLRHFGLIG